MRTTRGPVEISVPRDREGSFEPVLVPKHQRHFDGFDGQILSMYARGMSARDIQAVLKEMYGTDVGPDLIRHVTDAVVDDMRAWQSRPLEPVYPIVYLDALVTEIRDKGVVENKSAHIAVGVAPDGAKDVLGMWIQATEGAKFWLAILTELKQRGVKDVLVLCADGLTGMPRAVEAALPTTIFQTCIVHMIRSSTRFVPWKERRRACAELRKIYTAANKEDATRALGDFEKQCGARYPMIAPAWRARWGGDHALPLVSTGNPPRHLHDERRRGPPPPPPQGPQDEGTHAHRRIRAETAVPELQDRQALDATPARLAAGRATIRNLLPRPIPSMNNAPRVIHRNPDILASSVTLLARST